MSDDEKYDFKKMLAEGGHLALTITKGEENNPSGDLSIDDAVVYVPITKFRSNPGILTKILDNTYAELDEIFIIDDEEDHPDTKTELPSKDYQDMLRQTSAYQEAIQILKDETLPQEILEKGAPLRRYKVALEILDMQKQRNKTKPETNYALEQRIDAYRLALEDTLPGAETNIKILE